MFVAVMGWGSGERLMTTKWALWAFVWKTVWVVYSVDTMTFIDIVDHATIPFAFSINTPKSSVGFMLGIGRCCIGIREERRVQCTLGDPRSTLRVSF